jgi:hypothetical protein
LARDVVRRNPDLIIVVGNNLMLDLKAATTRDRFEAEERENDRRAGITPVGPLLERPIDEAEYRRAFAAVAQDRPDSAHAQPPAISRGW